MIGSAERVWLVAVGVLVAIVLVVIGGRVQKELRPEPRRAHVAVSVGGGAARDGRVEVGAGEPFRLHAVLEAEARGGSPVYYTDARELVLDGLEIPAEQMRSAEEYDDARILWFTVEGAAPYREVDAGEPLGELEFQEIFHADWARTWSVPGVVTSTQLLAASREGDLPAPDFGTLRYHVRIELFGVESEITPRHRLRSPGAADLPGSWRELATVSATHGGALAAATRVFGLPQIELPPGSAAADRARLVEWSEHGLAFSRVTLLRQLLDAAAVTWEDAGWAELELDGSREWLEAGDLLRAGERFVMLYRDEGTPGRLDYGDLCLDFDRGAAVRRLGEIFTGEGLVEWARLQ